MSIFIALPVPEFAKNVLRAALEGYGEKFGAMIPEEKWHVTLAFLGDQHISPDTLPQLQESLRCAYMPAITILSLGTGKATGQLWAHVHTTKALLELRNIIINRLEQNGIVIPAEELSREYIPHITLAQHMENSSGIGIPDTPANITFAARQALVLKSNSHKDATLYDTLAAIPLVP